MEWLYFLATRDPQAWRWRFRAVYPSFVDFERTFYNDVAAAFIVELSDATTPVGCVTCYGMNLRDGIASLAVQIQTVHLGVGHGVVSAHQMASYVMDRWPVRKLYLEVPAYNVGQFRSLVGSVLRQEGVLSEHIFLEGTYHDLIIFSIDRVSVQGLGRRLSGEWREPTRQPTDSEVTKRRNVSALVLDALDGFPLSVDDPKFGQLLREDSMLTLEVLSFLSDESGHDIEPSALEGIESINDLVRMHEQLFAKE